MKQESIIRCQFTTKRECSLHFHQDIEILYVLDGSLEVCYEEHRQQLGMDDFLLINSNVRHEYTALKEVLLGSVFINYAELTEMFGGEQLYFLCNSAAEKSEGYEKMRYYIRQIFNYYQTNEGQGIVLRNSIFYQLLYVLTSAFIVKKGMKQYDSLRGIADERMNEILGYIMSNYNESITLQELADKLFLSNAYLSKYIKRNFGMSFLKLVNNIRMEHAVSELLYSDKSVIKIAMDNGFPNLAGFNKSFREMYHMTPAEYRTETQAKMEKTDTEENSEDLLERVEHYLTSNLITAPEAADAAVTVLEADVKEKVRFGQSWRKMINIGPATDLLRFDVRDQIVYLKQKLGFEYVRFWNVLSDEMMIELDEKKTKYNFNDLDKIFDFLVGIGLKPYMELGFKQKEIYENLNKKVVDVVNKHQIRIIEKNKGFFEELIKHFVKRYGTQEVETWYVELEKNSEERVRVTADKYFDEFEIVAGIFRNYVPNLKIGGGGFCLNYLDREFVLIIEEWNKRKIRPDFISLYCYPYIMDYDLLEAGRNPYSTDESYLNNQIRIAKEVISKAGLDVEEFHVSEWSYTLSNRNVLNDSCFKAAYVMKNLIQNCTEADVIGYWMATDIFSDYLDTKQILFGGCGLVTKDTVRKPAFFAYQFLNMSGQYLLGRDKYAFITYDGKKAFTICCHNYKHFNFRYYLVEENEIEVEHQERMFEDNETRQMNFKIRHVNNGTYQVKTYSVNQEFGNIQREWEKIGYYDDLNLQEMEYLKSITQPKIFIRQVEVENGILEIESVLTAQEIQGISITEV